MRLKACKRLQKSDEGKKKKEKNLYLSYAGCVIGAAKNRKEKITKQPFEGSIGSTVVVSVFFLCTLV